MSKNKAYNQLGSFEIVELKEEELPMV